MVVRLALSRPTAWGWCDAQTGSTTAGACERRVLIEICDWWSWRLAVAVVQHAAGRPHVRVLSLALPSADEFEVTFVPVGGSGPLGIRLDRRVLDAGSSRLSGASVDELAFDVVVLGLVEPRGDGAGDPASPVVRWLSLDDWAQ